MRQLPSARHLDTPTLNDHIPDLLEELAIALQSRSDETVAEAFNEARPPAHGLQRFKDGFDIIEIVAEYNILQGCIHDLHPIAGTDSTRLSNMVPADLVVYADASLPKWWESVQLTFLKSNKEIIRHQRPNVSL